MVSKRLQNVPASGTVKIANLVSQMKADGVDIVSFSMGEPDFATPDNIVESCVESVRSGFTHYTPSMGITPLRKAIAAEAVSKGIPCKAANVLVTPTKQAIFMIALAYLDPGDEVLLPDPAWVSYEAVIRPCRTGCCRRCGGRHNAQDQDAHHKLPFESDGLRAA